MQTLHYLYDYAHVTLLYYYAHVTLLCRNKIDLLTLLYIFHSQEHFRINSLKNREHEYFSLMISTDHRIHLTILVKKPLLNHSLLRDSRNTPCSNFETTLPCVSMLVGLPVLARIKSCYENPLKLR